MKIQVELKKWGNSLGLRIPYQIVDSLDITENSKVNLEIEGNRLIIEKETEKPNLDAILDSIPNSEPVGNELL